MKAKDYYTPKNDGLITEKRFRDLFMVDRQDSFRLTSVLSNLSEVIWDTGKYMPKSYGITIFYKQGDNGHGGKCMKDVFRTNNYNRLVDYLFKIGEEWRLERSK